MPRANPITGPRLSIEVDKRGHFAAGETITGRVRRTAQLVDTKATVAVSLFGRAKTRIEERGGKSSSEYRGRFNFFDNPSVHSRLFRGPIHVPGDDPEGQAWPFTLTIPHSSSQRPTTHSHDQDASFLALDGRPHPLPASFFFGSAGSEGYVEYWIEATIRGSKTNETSKYPIHLPHSSSPIPITDFDLKANPPRTQYFNSQRLLPGMSQAKLSLGEKTRKLFGSSKIPVYAFQLDLCVPSVLQARNPNLIPFLLHVTPLQERTSEIIQDVPQTIVVTAFTLKVKTTTKLIAPGTLDEHHFSKSSTTTICSYKQPSRRKDAQGNADQRPGMDGKDGEVVDEQHKDPPPDADMLIVPSHYGQESLDLGAALGIKVNSQVQPTFTTYNIKVESKMNWTLGLSCAGESGRWQGSRDISVMARSEEQRR